MDCISGAAVVSSVFDFVVGWRGLESFDHWLCPLLPISEADHTCDALPIWVAEGRLERCVCVGL